MRNTETIDRSVVVVKVKHVRVSRIYVTNSSNGESQTFAFVIDVINTMSHINTVVELAEGNPVHGAGTRRVPQPPPRFPRPVCGCVGIATIIIRELESVSRFYHYNSIWSFVQM